MITVSFSTNISPIAGLIPLPSLARTIRLRFLKENPSFCDDVIREGRLLLMYCRRYLTTLGNLVSRFSKWMRISSLQTIALGLGIYRGDDSSNLNYYLEWSYYVSVIDGQRNVLFQKNEILTTFLIPENFQFLREGGLKIDSFVENASRFQI